MSRTRYWWISLPIQVGLVVLFTLQYLFGYRDIPPIFVGIITAILLIGIEVEEYRIARLTDRLNSLENKPKGKLRFW